jgi:hypothetical protein
MGVLPVFRAGFGRRRSYARLAFPEIFTSGRT